MTTTHSPWLRSAPREALLFAGSGVISVALAVPLYLALGSAIVGPLFVVHVVLLSLPHHCLTWTAISPRSVRRAMRFDLVLAASAVAVVVTLGAVLGATSFLGRLTGTAIGLLSVWHIYRQHLGICRVYDAVQTKRTGDRTLLADRIPLDAFLALGSFAMVVWLFGEEHLAWGNGGPDDFEPVYVAVPRWLFAVYVLATLVAAAATVMRTIVARHRAGKLVPWPQIAIATTAVLANNALFVVTPPRDTLLVVTVASSFHIVQYFGFVWLFERNRTPDLPDPALPQRLVLRGSALGFFGIALAYSAVLVGCAVLEPVVVGAFVITYSNVSHYLVDGVIWSGSWNPGVSPAVRRLAGASPA